MRKDLIHIQNGWFTLTADPNTGDIWMYSDGGDIQMNCETLRNVMSELERKGMYDG